MSRLKRQNRFQIEFQLPNSAGPQTATHSSSLMLVSIAQPPPSGREAHATMVMFPRSVHAG
ncbi:MAG TPA: hypothetical protein VHG30_09240 [Microvirga sp.]|nr:hypothetical protein [Microvirga sp.]